MHLLKHNQPTKPKGWFNCSQKNLWQLKSVKYFAMILDCTSDVFRQEQLIVINRYVQCDPREKSHTEREFLFLFLFFFFYLRVNESLVKACWNEFLVA